MKTEHFVLKPDSILYWVKDMPGEFTQLIPTDYATVRDFNQAMNANKNAYQSALQSAIDNAVEVSNQKEVFNALCKEYPMMDNQSTGKPFSLLCSVEKKEGDAENIKPLIDFKQEIAVSKGYKLWSELAENINPYSDEYELLYNEAWERFESQKKTVALVTFPESGALTMTKDQAISAMKEGKKVRHLYFEDYEWITMDGDKLLAEDGCRIPIDEFWRDRSKKEWETDWSIFPESESQEETQEQLFTTEQVIKILALYADQVYKGYYVHKREVEEILEIIEPTSVINEFLTRK
jgi:hypothetical protein